MKMICRLCLHKNNQDVMKNIFELSSMDSDLSIPNFLYWAFGIAIYPEDSFSKLICNKCVNIIYKVISIRHFFKTNQTILKEKQCPDNYVVQMGWFNTKEVGTNVNFKRRKYVTVSLNTIKKLNRTSVPINKLEDSFEVNNEYTRIGDTWYKKPKHKNLEAQNKMSLVKVEATDDDIKKSVSLTSKLKSNDDLEKREMLTQDANNELSNMYPEPCYNNFETCNDNCGDNFVTVPQKIFEQFSSPYVELELLETSNIVHSEYKKVSDYIYKKIESDNSKISTTGTNFKCNGQHSNNCCKVEI